MEQPLICPTCGNILVPDDVFCPRCGTKVGKDNAIGMGRQIWIYFVSLFLPPFGLIWVWKYIRSGNFQMRRVGWVALFLTIVGILITIWVTVGFLQGMQAQLNSYSSLGL